MTIPQIGSSKKSLYFFASLLRSDENDVSSDESSLFQLYALATLREMKIFFKTVTSPLANPGNATRPVRPRHNASRSGGTPNCHQHLALSTDAHGG